VCVCVCVCVWGGGVMFSLRGLPVIVAATDIAGGFLLAAAIVCHPRSFMRPLMTMQAGKLKKQEQC